MADRVRTVEGSIDDLSSVADGFDLVLCHFVLHYRAPDAGDLTRLASAVRPGGRLSVMAPNPHARVIMRLTREGPAAALAELATDDYQSATFDTTGRKVTADEIAAEMEESGLEVVARYAARVANAYLTDDTAKDDPDYYDALERPRTGTLRPRAVRPARRPVAGRGRPALGRLSFGLRGRGWLRAVRAAKRGRWARAGAASRPTVTALRWLRCERSEPRNHPRRTSNNSGTALEHVFEWW